MHDLLRRLFDAAHYRRLEPQLSPGADPLLHYLSEGWRKGLNPHPLFDVRFYLHDNPDIVAGGLEPWRHYLETGWREGRDPHPLFATSWYLQNKPDVQAAGTNPWEHYIETGWKEGRKPHPLFDGAYYLARNPDIAAAGVNPLVHYVLNGDAEGRRPNALFDPAWYREHFMGPRPPVIRPSPSRFEPSGLPKPSLQPAAYEKRIYAFTVGGLNYLPKAKVLASSLRKHNPEIRVCLLLNEPLIEEAVAELQEFDEVLEVTELGIPGLQSWVFKHNVVEFSTAIKPMYMERLLDRADAEAVLYFDPDMVVLGDLALVVDALRTSSILLTPHLTEPEVQAQAIADNEMAALRHGVFNLGFVGVRPTPEGRRFVRWWSDRTRDYCFADIASGLFTDQRWVDLAPGFFDDLRILRHPGCNVATWNLSHRHVAGDFENGFTSNGRPLIFYHFSGFDSGAQEEQLLKYGFRMPAAFALRRWYLRQLDDSGAAALSSRPWAYTAYDDGTPIPAEHRRRYRNDPKLQKQISNPFARSEPPAPPVEAKRADNALADYARRWPSGTVSPHPDFDTPYYLRTNPDIAAGGLEPLAHYLEFGCSEGRAPNEWYRTKFDKHFYLEEVEFAEGERPDAPFIHYVDVGQARGYRTYQYYDAAADAEMVRRFAEWASADVPVILNVVHVGGGGTERHVRDLARHYGDRARLFLIKPLRPHSKHLGLTPLRADRDPDPREQIHFDGLEQWEELSDVIRRIAVRRVHIQHAMGNEHYLEPLIANLGVPFDFTAHDYYVLAPSPSLCDRTGRFVGEDLEAHAEALIEHARLVLRPPATLEAWREGHRWIVERAGRVIVPSHDVARRLRRHFPEVEPVVAAHPQRVIAAPPRLRRRLHAGDPLTVAILGELSREKGLYLIRELGRIAAERSAALRIAVIGEPHEDRDLLERYGVKFTGKYEERELQGLFDELAPDLIWFSSLVPETFSYTLSFALTNGAPVVAPALGVFPERLGGRSWTWIEPWNRDEEEWLAFFERIRAGHFVTGEPPAPPPVAETATAEFYESEYLIDTKKAAVAGGLSRV